MKHSWAILNIVLKVSIPSFHSRCTTSWWRSPLPFFENRRKVTWFCKKKPWSWKKGALFVCIYGLNSHLKCSFKSILDKKHQFFFRVGLFYCMSSMKHFSNCPYSKKLPLPRKIPDCSPGLYTIKVLQDFQN